MGNPIDDATQQRIDDRIKEVLATFGTEFSKVRTIFYQHMIVGFCLFLFEYFHSVSIRKKLIYFLFV